MLPKPVNTWTLARYCILQKAGCTYNVSNLCTFFSSDVPLLPFFSFLLYCELKVACFEMSHLCSDFVLSIQWQRVSLIPLACDFVVYENVLCSSPERGFHGQSSGFQRQACGNLGWAVKTVHIYYHYYILCSETPTVCKACTSKHGHRHAQAYYRIFCWDP